VIAPVNQCLEKSFRHTPGETRMTAAPARKAVVLYDGQCPFCLRSVATLRRLDWLHQLDPQDARDEARLPATYPPLDPAKLLEEMHLVTPDRRRVYRGFAAFRWIAGRLPLLWPLVPLLYLPGVPWLGQRLYCWIARNRYNLTPCHDGACQLPSRRPPRKQPADR
jgi:predicted DCC family thiol-disulfide oxidoreductase YuxK